MLAKELAEKIGAEIISGTGEPDVTGCYIGDLLSLVMSKARFGDCWITVQPNINIVAVATLNEVACILLCEGCSVADDALAKAKSEDITILRSEKSAYALALEIGKIL